MKNLILLQENSGNVDFLNSILDINIRNLVKTFIDGLAENFESIKTSLQMFGYYDHIINLTDSKCTKANLLAEMISQTRAGNIFDLLILGHGSYRKLYLHGNETMNNTEIRGLLAQARTQYAGIKFNLRLVYMCNCFSGSLLDDWIAIGAKAALGCNDINYMPEPQTTFFFDNFIKRGFSVTEANNQSFQASNAMWALTGLSSSKRNNSKLSAKGDNIKFEGRRLATGETVERNIYANNAYNFTNLLLLKDEKYEFKVPHPTSDKWKNGSREATAKGYTKGLFDVPRQPSYNMMELTGEIFNDNNNALSYSGTHIKISTSKTWTVSRSGYLVCHANDNLLFYGDNSGKITVKIKRLS